MTARNIKSRRSYRGGGSAETDARVAGVNVKKQLKKSKRRAVRSDAKAAVRIDRDD